MNSTNPSKSDFHDEHKKYVESLIKLQDKEGKRLSGSLESLLKRVFRLSGGDLRKLLKLMQIIKPKLMKEIKAENLQSLKRARALGRDFGEKKLV